MKYGALFILLYSFIFMSCSDNKSKIKVTEIVQDKIENPVREPIIIKDSVIRKTRVLILPCSNGYGVEIPIELYIKNALKKDTMITVMAFPYKKLKGVAYYGVYDKKYSTPIIEKTDADYLIMSEFIGHGVIAGDLRDSDEIGYGIRILNTKTLQQTNSIRTTKLKSFNDIEKDILSKRQALLKDLKATDQ